MKRTRTQSREAADRMRQLILERLNSGPSGAGERLPTEREWVEQLDMSRSAVRKVLAELNEQGLIERTVGSGTVITPAFAGHSEIPAEEVSPSDVMQARLLFEVAMVDLIVHNATTRDFDAMEAYLDASENARSAAEFEAGDEGFHRTLAHSTRNPLVREMYELIGRARGSQLWGKLKQRSLTPENRLRYQRDHREILEALRRRDLERARELTQQHLLRIQANLLEGHRHAPR
ncbi:FadR/GntR family transcriptional regulator [Variovorax sp. YR634]|uniref:FadR/GntR family transcriptional regulator n=1 Tax=Variovorax sp. YR634 TaxID=1884385 RepID=UPI000B838135|nr:FCD domain-containing protein [Variovorax sp. YR634]